MSRLPMVAFIIGAGMIAPHSLIAADDIQLSPEACTLFLRYYCERMPDDGTELQVVALRTLLTVPRPDRPAMHVLLFEYTWSASKTSRHGTQRLLLLSRDWRSGGAITLSTSLNRDEIAVEVKGGRLTLKQRGVTTAVLDVRGDASLIDGAVMWRSFNDDVSGERE